MFNQKGFDQFWACYPKRIGKLAAQRAWDRLKPNDDLVRQMLTTIGWQRATEQWRRGYVPNPVTWLNQGRWMDEPDVTQQSTEWVCPDSPPCPAGTSKFRCHQRSVLEAARRERLA